MFKQTPKDLPSPQPVDAPKLDAAPEAQPTTPAPQPAPTPPIIPAAAAPAPTSSTPISGGTAFSSAAPARPAGSAAASIIAPDLLIKGGIEGRGEIQLQGKAWGDVKVERLMVGEAATLEGSVEAIVVEVRGHVTGSIAARQVKLHPSAKVEGDITYEQLSIDNGAFFEGRCIKNKGDAAPSTPTNGAAKGKSTDTPAT